MDIAIQTRNIEINSEVRDTIQKKLIGIQRHLPDVTRASVEVSAEPTRSQQHRVVLQVTLEVEGNILRGEQRAPSVGAALNAVTDALNRRVEKYKSHAYRSERSRRNVPLRAQEAEEFLGPNIPEGGRMLPGGDLVRLKRFQMKPMTVEEAAAQMDLLGHSFYMFLNSEVDQYNLLYAREDGNYGLIQPALD